MTYLKPSQKEGKKFLNPIPTFLGVKGGMMKTMWQMLTVKAERVPKKQLGPFKTDPHVYDSPPASGLRITWMGHSGLLIEIDGKRFLTDPVWGRASFVSWAGPKRFYDAPIALKQLPSLDAIIISHDHYDHLDSNVIKELAQSSIPFICPIGVGAILENMGIAKNRITEMDWMDCINIGDCKITALPARHFTGRSIINRNESLWASFAIKGHTHNIYYGADSGWHPAFEEIGNVFGPFDLTMLEIGAYGEGWPDIHMGPDHASNAHLALKGKLMMPIHWGTFNLALHAWDEPVMRVLDYAKQKGIALVLPEPGKPTEINGTEHISGWWEK